MKSMISGKFRFLILLLIITAMWLPAQDRKRAILVRNSLNEIKACMGKIKLKQIRVWGGDNEEDEHKFFKVPGSVAVDKNSNVYICDSQNHLIKVFSANGKYLRTIGRRGRGPGDLFGPAEIAFSPGGDLWVHENGGWRVQCFSPNGKSKRIFKNTRMNNLIGVTSNDELVINNHWDTLESRKLLWITNHKGKVLRKIGKHHFKIKHYLRAEHLRYALDENDNIYAANTRAPVIRKYSSEGKLLQVITFDLPFNVPYGVTLNENGDEINRIYETKATFAKVKRNGGTFQTTRADPHYVLHSIKTDSRKNVFVVTQRRLKTTEERKAGIVTSIAGTSHYSIEYKKVNYHVLENARVYRLLVFNPMGKVIAAVNLQTITSSFYIFGDRVFFLDGFHQHVVEYKMIWTDKKDTTT